MVESTSYLRMCKRFSVAGIQLTVRWELGKTGDWTGKLASAPEVALVKAMESHRRTFFF